MKLSINYKFKYIFYPFDFYRDIILQKIFIFKISFYQFLPVLILHIQVSLGVLDFVLR